MLSEVIKEKNHSKNGNRERKMYEKLHLIKKCLSKIAFFLNEIDLKGPTRFFRSNPLAN